MLLSANNLYTIFTICTDVLNIEFKVAGITVSLMGFIIFEIVSVILLALVFSLFKGN